MGQFSDLNWVDIFIAIVLFRIIYIAMHQGMIIELFKLLGCISAIFFSVHYYTLLSGVIPSGLMLPQIFARIFSFVLLALFGYFLIFLFRVLFFRFFKIEAAYLIDKWLALFIGIIRGIFVSSLILLFFLLISIGYLHTSIHSSFAGARIAKIGSRVYAGVWENLASKFLPGSINSAIFQIIERGN